MTYLADKSALARAQNETVAQRLRDLALRDQLATCAIVDLELLYSVRNANEYERVHEARAGYVSLPMGQDTFGQALALQRSLVEIGKHRRPIPDLLIAAVALLNGATVLHYDHDFEIIAEVCELKHEWVAPKGSL